MLNRGEAVNALKHAIYVGRVASYQAKQHEEMQALCLNVAGPTCQALRSSLRICVVWVAFP